MKLKKENSFSDVGKIDIATINIKEHSWLAHIAARKLKSDNVAFVLGNTIYLWGVSKKYFLEDENWVKHELVHIAQFKKYGYFQFIILYLFESLKNGYYNNKFEIEAREKESC